MGVIDCTDSPWQASIIGPQPWWHLGFRYYITLSSGWMGLSSGYFAWTAAGAERKAKRICRRLNRRDELRRCPRVVTS